VSHTRFELMGRGGGAPTAFLTASVSPRSGPRPLVPFETLFRSAAILLNPLGQQCFGWYVRLAFRAPGPSLKPGGRPPIARPALLSEPSESKDPLLPATPRRSESSAGRVSLDADAARRRRARRPVLRGRGKTSDRGKQRRSCFLGSLEAYATRRVKRLKLIKRPTLRVRRPP